MEPDDKKAEVTGKSKEKEFAHRRSASTPHSKEGHEVQLSICKTCWGDMDLRAPQLLGDFRKSQNLEDERRLFICLFV